MDDCSMKNDFNGCFNTFEGGKGLVKISGEKLRAATGGCDITSHEDGDQMHWMVKKVLSKDTRC